MAPTPCPPPRPAALSTRITHRLQGSGPAIPGDTRRGRPESDLPEILDEALREAAAIQTAAIPVLSLDTTALTAQESADALFEVLQNA